MEFQMNRWLNSEYVIDAILPALKYLLVYVALDASGLALNPTSLPKQNPATAG